jgi:hypothetical protein
MASPIKEAIRMLLNRRTEELTSVSRKADALTRKLCRINNYTSTVTVIPKTCFGVIFENEGCKKYQTAIQQSQSTIAVVAGWLQFRKLCFLCETPIKNALKKGITSM